ncbi:MAG: cobaltochelatase subunit CobN [Marinifilaceae bacterium]
MTNQSTIFNILFITGKYDNTYQVNQARKFLEEACPGAFQFQFYNYVDIDQTPGVFDEVLQSATGADMVFITSHGGFTHFRRFKELFDELSQRNKIFLESGIQDEVDELRNRLNISPEEFGIIYRYYSMGGVENLSNLFQWMANIWKGGDYSIFPPQSPEWEGIYGIDGAADNYFKEVAASDKPVIGVLFHAQFFHTGNVAHIEAIKKEIEDQGAIPLVCYTGVSVQPELGRKGVQWLIDEVLIQNGRPVVDAIINTLGYSQTILGNPGDGTAQMVEESIHSKLGVPVIQSFQVWMSEEEWRKSQQGVDGMTLVSGIYYPEFDGQIISYPSAYTVYESDEFGTRYRFKPIQERIQKVCSLAKNWALLRYKKNEEKKVAIILHNMPPRNDQIGCAWGLDTPASVYNIIESLRESGISTTSSFQDGEEIIQKIIDGVTNDTQWSSPEQMVEKSIDLISGEQYRIWFDKLPREVQNKMQEDWGEAPGEFLVHQNQMPIPGILNGNVFIGLQPARAFEEKAEECYHSTDFVCPHQYVAFYKWVKHIFEADVILHIGTHGTLEWLPGKEKGLSDACYPDITISDLPHLYPYCISVVGEGIQAKRRSAAVLNEHMIPSMVESGTYNELSQLDEQLKDYYHAKGNNEKKVASVANVLWEMVEKLHLDQDLQISREKAFADFDAFLEQLHVWMERIKTSIIKDGLHIFGQPEEKVRFRNMLRLLTRIPNGTVPALNEGIADAMGYDYALLLDQPTRIWEEGQTSLRILDELTEKAVEVIQELEDDEYQIAGIKNIVGGINPETTGNGKLEEVLHFICEEVVPRLLQTTDELKWLVDGVNGRMVDPGPGGCPSRGNALILPSGRNFYSINPQAVPTRASWEVGKRMADDLLERYRKDEGKLPEGIAIVMYAGDVMKTYGDDIAEILYLMGVKPVWLGNTQQVSGLELIPLEELQRPRIDVTCRISGLFRDTFPNLIELLDDAVNLVAVQDEDIEMNYIRKHVLEDVEEMKNKGVDPEIAEQEALLRVFGCPPGTYGGGVDILVNSKKWESNEDLATISTTWSCHAYGRKVHGEKRPDLYGQRLAKTDATVKNEVSKESDIYDIDDEFIYHGGMIAATQKFSGKKPRSYYGNSADPMRTEIASVQEETARVVRARILNPKWIEGLKEHGYKGAQDVAYMMENVFGWDATADVVEDWMYEQITEHYLLNEENRKWLEEANKWAAHKMTERLLEAIQRGMWDAKEEYREQLVNLYLQTEGNIENGL